MVFWCQLRPLVPLYVLGACAAHTLAVAPRTPSLYCSGELLRRIQLARIFPDSKTFVDLKLLQSEKETLANFKKLLNVTGNEPTRTQLADFVNKHFAEGNELEEWQPPDFNPNPTVLATIKDPVLKDFAKDVIAIWLKLGRKASASVARNPDRYSFLYVPNGFIAPGGRFKELYYWDSFWTVRGLLISNMTHTARGMIENLLYLVDTYGYIPNGSRVYYLGRSQPPLLAAMVATYFAATGDLGWLEKHLPTVEREIHYWLEHKQVPVSVDGVNYLLLRFSAERNNEGPRPESYYEDYYSARALPSEDARQDFYFEMKSAAESGWDFSSRWFIVADPEARGNLTDVHATRILPVDLNAIFAGALELAGDFRHRLKDRRAALKWWSLAKYWRRAIKGVFWHEGDGVWYDYDAEARAPRRHFFPSCATPLWAGAVEPTEAPMAGARLVRYLLRTGALDFPGGVPASILHSGEQWDYPNAWPPLQSILIGALEASGEKDAQLLAREQAALWVRANHIGYSRWQKMFEKYSAVHPGSEGSGGEYVVQDGFGWTNGVLLELLDRYGGSLSLHDAHNTNMLPYIRHLNLIHTGDKI